MKVTAPETPAVSSLPEICRTRPPGHLRGMLAEAGQPMHQRARG
jgi:hypothetical protein